MPFYKTDGTTALSLMFLLVGASLSGETSWQILFETCKASKPDYVKVLPSAQNPQRIFLSHLF